MIAFKKSLKYFFLNFILFLYLGCGGSATGESDLKNKNDAIVVETMDFKGLDFIVKDTKDSLSTDTISEQNETQQSETDVAKGKFGYPCTTNSDCESGYCIEGFDGFICTKLCDDVCPEGFSCRVLLNYYPDIISVCVPNVLKLCSPCQNDGQCYGGKCVKIEDKTYCVSDCSKDGKCPDSYECKEYTEGDNTFHLCMPTNNSCECRPENAGQTRTCTIENEFGKCYGFEVCDAEKGFINCSAKTPEEEVCDGVDNDCNGLIDDGLPEKKECFKEVPGVGKCMGFSICAGAAGWVCNAKNPEKEVCDYKDNDCDGETDEDFKKDGKYVDFEHCGSCNNSCENSIPFAKTIKCDDTKDVPDCVVVECEEGYFKLNEYQCIVPPNVFCKECENDDECFGNVCKELGDGKYCLKKCENNDDCMEGYLCNDEKVCIPESGTCDCNEQSIGMKKACSVSNEFGECFGFMTCLGKEGWSSCDAKTPSEEECNGIDDDCNGLTDDGLPESKPCKNVVDGVGVCEGVAHCQGVLGWVCDAKTPEVEKCDYEDNDCDGLTDEDFKIDGKYAYNDNCGVCNFSCTGKIKNGTAKCDYKDFDPPKCVVDKCDEGYYPVNQTLCLPVVDNSCKVCVTDADCEVLGDKCIKTEEGSFCFTNCSENGFHGGNCNEGFECKEIYGGKFCVPETGSCTCLPQDAGKEELCFKTNEYGTCYGKKVCTENGWTECNAKEPKKEICNNEDDDCDGVVDLVDGLGEECFNTVEGVGSCKGVYVCDTENQKLVCNAKTPQKELCNSVDDDCDGLTDEDFDKLYKVCTVGTGICTRNGIYVCSENGDGVVCNTEPGEPQTEICNGVDDNCNGETDEYWDNLGKICENGVGICKKTGIYVCDKENPMQTVCNAVPGEPLDKEICNYQDDNCDGKVDEDFVDENGKYFKVTDCGYCGNDCNSYWVPSPDAFHLIPLCNTENSIPLCDFQCMEGYADLDEVYDNGCEFKIEDDVVYVKTPANGGTASPSCGTYDNPCATIQLGINRAYQLGKSKVYVSDGVYEENIVLKEGISIYGGYNHKNWQRNPDLNITLIKGKSSLTDHVKTVIANNITLKDTVIDGFVIQGAQTQGESKNSYVIYVKNSNSYLKITNNIIIAGRGGDGKNGKDGEDGENGKDGEDGNQALDTGTQGCTNLSNPGGKGGLLLCGDENVSGGDGGASTCPIYYDYQQNGGQVGNPANPCCSSHSTTGCVTKSVEECVCENDSYCCETKWDSICAAEVESYGCGKCDTPDNCGDGVCNEDELETCENCPADCGKCPGAGGDGGYNALRSFYGNEGNDCDTCYQPLDNKPKNGTDGIDGERGVDGIGGDGCINNTGTIVNGEWQATSGTKGTNGTNGKGGGGGGAGGGSYLYKQECATTAGGDDLGGSGGGGGSGGCGAKGGEGGTSGGGAFGIFIVLDQEPQGSIDVPVIENNEIRKGIGGNGGNGGNGGVGGIGGDGGAGGAENPAVIAFCSGSGGHGGRGGDGGHGGGGGGGCGGASIGIFINKFENYKPLYHSTNIFKNTGKAGEGGKGGKSLSGNNGKNGADGLYLDVNYQ